MGRSLVSCARMGPYLTNSLGYATGGSTWIAQQPRISTTLTKIYISCHLQTTTGDGGELVITIDWM
nr:unnamed protein product [Callosobruchus analis]